MTTEPRSSRDFVGASGLVSWHRRASAMTRFPDSPANQRNGMPAAPVGTLGETRRQAVKRIAGVSVKLQRGDKSGGFSKRKTKWSRRKGRRSWSLLLTPCPCEASRANSLSSATGNASRRIADVLAGRSLAACFSTLARARSARTGNAVTVRAARGAQRRGLC